MTSHKDMSKTTASYAGKHGVIHYSLLYMLDTQLHYNDE